MAAVGEIPKTRNVISDLGLLVSGMSTFRMHPYLFPMTRKTRTMQNTSSLCKAAWQGPPLSVSDQMCSGTWSAPSGLPDHELHTACGLWAIVQIYFLLLSRHGSRHSPGYGLCGVYCVSLARLPDPFAPFHPTRIARASQASIPCRTWLPGGPACPLPIVSLAMLMGVGGKGGCMKSHFHAAAGLLCTSQHSTSESNVRTSPLYWGILVCSHFSSLTSPHCSLNSFH